MDYEALPSASTKVIKFILSYKPGSPKRRPFQRQRAASETTDHTEDDSSPLQDEVIESDPHTSITSGLQSLSAESLSHPANTIFQNRYATLQTGDLHPELKF